MQHPCDHNKPHLRGEIKDTIGSRLLVTLALNLVIPLVQIIGGLVAHSMALISDAIHNFSDFTAILISYIAFRIGKKGASVRNTFGYRRAEIMAALLNVALLVGASIFIIYGAIHRLYAPQPVSGLIVAWIAGVGVVGNGLSAGLLLRDSKHSLNVRGAFLHMLGDFFTSVVVVINGIILIFKPWYWIDPLLSLLIVVFILKNCWGIFKEASNVLMNATPAGLNLDEIKDMLERLSGIIGVHYLHAWNLSSSGIAFSCHVVVAEQPVSHTEALNEIIRNKLFHHFGIDHPVLQFETSSCGNGSMLCEINCDGSVKSPISALRCIS
ncbi:MAG: cation diffusion facilitator family transporter [Desulfobacterales bacterium]|nr:cation diffusion facilitator family transporter [Desulfobacterales bacterium]